MPSCSKDRGDDVVMNHVRVPIELVNDPSDGVWGWSWANSGVGSTPHEDDDAKDDDGGEVDQSEEDSSSLGAESNTFIRHNALEVPLIAGFQLMMSCSGGQEVLVPSCRLALALDRQWTGFQNVGRNLFVRSCDIAINLDLIVACRYIITPTSLRLNDHLPLMPGDAMRYALQDRWV